MNILLTGTDKGIGKAFYRLFKQNDGDGTLYPRIIVNQGNYDVIVHTEEFAGIQNVLNAYKLLEEYPNTPFVYISTKQPRDTEYGFYKFLTELVVNEMADKHLIIRPSSENIEPLLVKEILSWNMKRSKLLYIG
jgi:hypothetical protein